MKTLNTVLYLRKFKNLWFLTNFLGITSFYQNNGENKKIGKWKKFVLKVYVVVLLVAFQVINAFQMEKRVQWSFNKLTTTGNVILSLNTSFLVLLNFLVSYELNFNKAISCENFAESLLQLDYLLYINIGVTMDAKSTDLPLVVIHMITLYIVAIDFWVWYDTLGFDNYFYYIFDVFQRYRIEIIILSVYILISDFYYKVKTINTILKSISLSKKGKYESYVPLNHLKDEIPYGNRVKDLKTALNCIGIAYSRIYDTCKMFNDIFGWILLVIYISFMLTFIAPVNVLITFEAKGLMTWSMIAWNASLMMHAIVGAVVISSICHKTTKEAQKTASLAYTLLHNLDLKRECDEPKILMENLILLIRQSTTRNPSFSAAGFFSIDYSTLFTLTNLLTSYVIVLIQFK